ncbi:MAG: outer membrane lipoprotein LolB [Comamonas sp.]
MRRRTCCLAAWAGTASALLAACATPTRTLPPSTDRYWMGRLSLQTREERPQGFSASFELSGQPQRGELVLTSPIGNRIAEVQWTRQQAILRQGSRSQTYASLDELIEQLTGTAIPVAALFDWLAGTPTAVPGWNVDLSRQPDGRLLATRLWPAPATELRVVLQSPS